MQLLVSVRSADEVSPALAGGADIIDAKEPDRGSLGAVDRAVLRRILQRVPDSRSVSVALGDFGSEAEVFAALDALPLAERGSPIYLKLGFAGVSSPDRIRQVIEAAVSGASRIAASPRVVAVGYADFERARTVPPALIPPLAEAAGAAGVLLDTHDKEGAGLLGWLGPGALVDWVASACQAGLIAALAGSLQTADLALVCLARPDVVGVRGAACDGGRRGLVSQDRVGQFKRALTRQSGGSARARALGATSRNA